MIYGYARVSTAKQNIERQIRNILHQHQEAKIYQDHFTGTKVIGRTDFEKLLKIVKSGDTIIFDSVSRMSRNAGEGFDLYENLFHRNINLEFIKEAHINTAVYRAAIQRQLDITVKTGNTATDSFINKILDALNAYALDLAKEQIRLAFEQAEKEVTDLQQRTKEGLETARKKGKVLGQKKGAKLHIKKADTAKEIILKHSKSFNGMLDDKDCIKLTEISRNSYYKYKKELLEQYHQE